MFVPKAILVDVGYLPNFSQGLGDEETQLSSPGVL